MVLCTKCMYHRPFKIPSCKFENDKGHSTFIKVLRGEALPGRTSHSTPLQPNIVKISLAGQRHNSDGVVFGTAPPLAVSQRIADLLEG